MRGSDRLADADGQRIVVGQALLNEVQ